MQFSLCVNISVAWRWLNVKPKHVAYALQEIDLYNKINCVGSFS